jgi:quinol monooxygenase YgiN
VFVVIRFRVDETAQPEFVDRLDAAVEVLSRQRGFLAARVGRNADDPDLLALSMEWQNIGSYRRALSPYEVKLAAVPVLSQAIDEPTAYELIGSAAPDRGPWGSDATPVIPAR